MTERYDALCVREDKGKAYFTRVGVAFKNRNGNGYSVLLDAMPAPTDGQFRILLREPQPRDGGSRSNQSNGHPDDYDSNPPF